MIILRLNLRNSIMGSNSKDSPPILLRFLMFYCLNFKAINISILNVNLLFVTGNYWNFRERNWKLIRNSLYESACVTDRNILEILSFHTFVFSFIFSIYFFISPDHLAQRQITNYILLPSYFQRSLLRTLTVNRSNCSESETPISLTNNNFLNETDEHKRVRKIVFCWIYFNEISKFARIPISCACCLVEDRSKHGKTFL